MAVDSTIQFKRGKQSELPYGLEGEPLYCLDTNTLYIGQGKDKAPKPITGGTSVGGGANIDDDSTDGISVTWSAKKLNEMFKDLMYEPIKITAFTYTPSKTVYEIGESVTGIEFMWATTKPSTSLYITDCSIYSPTETSAEYPVALTATKTFTLRVGDEKGSEAIRSVTYSFVNPYYYGTFTDSLTEQYILAQNKLVQTKSNKTIKLTYTDQKVFFATPKSYGEIKDIKDNNGFSYIKEFTRNEMVIKGVSYYVYTLEDKASVTNISFTFSY